MFSVNETSMNIEGGRNKKLFLSSLGIEIEENALIEMNNV